MMTFDSGRPSKTPEPCILVIFGATGDLTSRKLVPALYNLAREGFLPKQFACVGFARRDKSDAQFRDEMKQAVNQFSRVKPVDDRLWESFGATLSYHKSEFHEDEGYERLKTTLDKLDQQFGTKGNRVFYLSTPPSYFPDIVQKLAQHQLIYNAQTKDKWSRIIIEKPFGHDLTSALELQNQLRRHLQESQIYRIDHYLGKETVQNLFVFRFCNPIFEDLMNNHHVDNVQITVAEDIGIGTRGKFFEEAGILRDIVQNHMMQLLSLIAMEAPASMRSSAIHDEKVKVLDSIRSLKSGDFDHFAVRGQYGPNVACEGEKLKGYREEDNVDPQSFVETYAALELFIDNWRWTGVPFYLRAGKRLPQRVTEIAITFKHVPGFVSQQIGQKLNSNLLVIRIQPDEGIALRMNCKVPGTNSPIQPVKMDFRYGTYFGSTPPEAYERLICDCMAGDSTLFARDDEVIASWKLLTPLLDYWGSVKPLDFPNYPANSWGPREADLMLLRDDREWRIP